MNVGRHQDHRRDRVRSVTGGTPGATRTTDARACGRLRWRAPDANDPGLLTPAQTSLLTDQYELAMASSYLGRGMNETVVFELFVRRLPPRRRWLLAAGLGPAVAMV